MILHLPFSAAGSAPGVLLSISARQSSKTLSNETKLGSFDDVKKYILTNVDIVFRASLNPCCTHIFRKFSPFFVYLPARRRLNPEIGFGSDNDTRYFLCAAGSNDFFVEVFDQIERGYRGDRIDEDETMITHEEIFIQYRVFILLKVR